MMKKNDVRVSSFEGDVSKHINTLPTPCMHYSFKDRSSLPPRLRAYKNIDSTPFTDDEFFLVRVFLVLLSPCPFSLSSSCFGIISC